jgi:coenzyme F420-0:L-glutamate ligase / coenzyme F420-1:gamma-L-glutamate ligase
VSVDDRPPDLRLFALEGIPEVKPGDDLAGLILAARSPDALHDGDVLVIAQKAVSKAEGRLLDLAMVEPSDFARRFAEANERDPRHIEAILRESKRIVKMDRGLLVCETRHGFICANAGLDLSNVPGQDIACLLPIDSDVSAAGLRQALRERAGIDLAVIISDTFGRPWREGVVNVAIGVAGMDPLESFVGKVDPYGYELHTTLMAPADELASAAELVMGKLRQVPAVVIRGYPYVQAEGSSRPLVRDPARDLFR